MREFGQPLPSEWMRPKVIGEMMERSIRFLSHDARWIMIAAPAGTMTQIGRKNICARNVRIIGSSFRSRPPEENFRCPADLMEKGWNKLSEGAKSPSIASFSPITEAAQALLPKDWHVEKFVLEAAGWNC